MLSSIKISEFQAGVWLKQYEYKSFSPTLINRQWEIDDPSLQKLITEAHYALGELNGYSHLIPDVDFFIKMHEAHEAVTSSRIEGTRTNMEEAFMHEEDVDPEKRDDWQEVRNYIQAMNRAIGELEKLPLSGRLLRAAHEILLQGVRGKRKLPGDFRKSQNWIGGTSLRDAVFIPPHHDEVPELMGDLEKFLNNDGLNITDLVRIAIAHYQFETIHPFLDGNGRIGRLLITLYLVSKKLLTKPALYLSDFFDKNRTLYYDNLMKVRLKNDLTQWLKFFMVGVIETAQSSIQTFQDISILRMNIESTILVKLGKKQENARALVMALYKNPVLTAQDVSDILKVSPPTANALVRDLCDLKLLVEVTGMKRNRVFVFESYIQIFTK